MKKVAINGYQIKIVVIIIFFILSIFSPFFGLIGVVLMWFWAKTWKLWVKILVTLPFSLIPLFFISYLFFFRPFQIGGSGMSPTYNDKAYLLTEVFHNSQSV